MVDRDLPYVEVPEKYRRVLGEPDPGTRMYRAYGPAERFRLWYRVVCRVCPDGVISPGGVMMYTRCTRAGVHKRMREGRITAFLYHVVKGRNRFTGRETYENGGHPYAEIPVIECEAWGKMLNTKATPAEQSAEAWGDQDFDGQFMAVKPRKVPKGKRAAK